MKPTTASLALAATLLGTTLTLAQIKIPGVKGPNINLGKGLERFLQGEAPLSTRHADLYAGLRTLDGWNPKPELLTEADKTDGKWMLGPGIYRMPLQAFCGRGYAKGPFRGLGYGVAPFRGSQDDLIRKVLQRYPGVEGVSQSDTQLILWAMLSRTKPSKMNANLRPKLALFLAPKEIARLEGFGLDALKDDAMNKVTGRVDAAMRPFLAAENRFRAMVARTDVPFERIEALMVPVDPDLKSSVAWGRWIPDGTGRLVRYLPERYSLFNVEVVVPHEPKITRDAKGRIVRLESAPGVVSEATYADEVPPFKIPGEPKLVAYAVKRIRLTSPNEESGAPRTSTYDVRTFLLQGTYSGRSIQAEPETSEFAGMVASLHPFADAPTPAPDKGWFGGWGDRAKKGKDTYDDWKDFQEAIERRDRIKNGKATMDDFLETKNYAEMIKGALGGTGDAAKELGKHTGRLNEAVAAATDAVGKIPGGSGEFDPTGDVATPGNPGGQLGLVSGKGAR